MTEAEGIWEQIRDLRDETPYGQAAIEIIDTALKKIRNEAIDEMETKYCEKLHDLVMWLKEQTRG